MWLQLGTRSRLLLLNICTNLVDVSERMICNILVTLQIPWYVPKEYLSVPIIFEKFVVLSLHCRDVCMVFLAVGRRFPALS